MTAAFIDQIIQDWPQARWRMLRLAVIGASAFALGASRAPGQDKLTHASRWAADLAGCYRLSRLAADSAGIPDTLRLLTRPVRELGYHRLLFFHTSLTVAHPHAETPPIWSPEAADSVTIELAPSSTGGPTELYLSLAVRGDMLVGHLEQRIWDPPPVRGTGPPRSTLVPLLPVRGTREHCSS